MSSLKFIFKVPFHAKFIFTLFEIWLHRFAFPNGPSGEREHQDIEGVLKWWKQSEHQQYVHTPQHAFVELQTIRFTEVLNKQCWSACLRSPKGFRVITFPALPSKYIVFRPHIILQCDFCRFTCWYAPQLFIPAWGGMSFFTSWLKYFPSPGMSRSMVLTSHCGGAKVSAVIKVWAWKREMRKYDSRWAWRNQTPCALSLATCETWCPSVL